MRKILLFFIVGIFLISGFEVGGLSKGESEIVVISFSNPAVQEKEDSYWLDLEGTNFVFIRENYYVVPAYIRTFTFPVGTIIEDVRVAPKDIHSIVLDKELCIAPQPVLMASNLKSLDVKKPADTSSVDIWFDFDIGTGIVHGYSSVVVKVLAFPVQYKPEKNLLNWAQQMEIHIEHKYLQPKSNKISDEFYDLLVLSIDDFSDELADLINHKISSGISAKFVSLEDVYNSVYFPADGRDDQEKIKYFIKNAFDSWDVDYVLLVGGNESFPTRRSHVYMDDWDDGSFVSDLYYADIYNGNGDFSSWDTNNNGVFGEFNVPGIEDDEVDLYPDVYLGRLACIDENEVSDCVQKIINYESNKAYTKGWFTNFVGIGGDTHIGDPEGIDEGEYINDIIIENLDCIIPIRLYASLGMLSGYSPTGSARITNKINSGCGFLNFIGHGATWGFGTHPHGDQNTWLPTPNSYYRSDDVMSLVNGGSLPIVFNSGCDVGKFHEDVTCFAWAFVKNPNGGGIASCGASAVSYGGYGTDAPEVRVGKMIVNMYDAYKEKAVVGSTVRFGEMWSNAITNYIIPGMTDIDYKVVESWEPFSDPSLLVAEESQLPFKPTPPVGEVLGKINVEYTYTASTTDPDGDNLYYLFDWGDNSYSDWIGPSASGEEVSANHKWTTKGSYDIRVKAKDIHGVQSEWSDPLPINMPRNKMAKNNIFLSWFERFPNLFSILQYIFKL